MENIKKIDPEQPQNKLQNVIPILKLYYRFYYCYSKTQRNILIQ